MEVHDNVALAPFKGQWKPVLVTRTRRSTLAGPKSGHLRKIRSTQKPRSTFPRQTSGNGISKAPQQSILCKAPTVTAPLSRLTRHLTSIPVRPMEDFVRRPLEEREREVAQKPGKRIGRPLNSFMLYRAAYAERAKVLYVQGDHQIISKIIGQSWRLEQAQIREFYVELANLEKQAHSHAFPFYKFSPSKTPRRSRELDLISKLDDAEESVDNKEFTPTKSRQERKLSNDCNDTPKARSSISPVRTAHVGFAQLFSDSDEDVYPSSPSICRFEPTRGGGCYAFSAMARSPPQITDRDATLGNDCSSQSQIVNMTSYDSDMLRLATPFKSCGYGMDTDDLGNSPSDTRIPNFDLLMDPMLLNIDETSGNCYFDYDIISNDRKIQRVNTPEQYTECPSLDDHLKMPLASARLLPFAI